MRPSVAAVGTLLVSLAIVGCARPIPPSGGPTDDSPPTIVATSPSLLERNVDTARALRVVFSEPMRRSSVEDALVVRPALDWGPPTWRGDTLVAYPREGWAPATTYTVLLRGSVADRRGNTLAEPGLVVFSTGASVADARLSGRVERIGISSGSVLVLAFTEPIADTSDVDVSRAVSVSEPRKDGAFLLPGLHPSTAYEVGAWFDIDEDRSFDAGGDLYARAREMVIPDSSGAAREVSITLVFPDEKGQITGTIVDTTCAALTALRRALAERAESAFAERESLRVRRDALQARADSLFGEAVAPEALDGDPSTLRARAEEIRREAGALVLADSTAILALARLPDEALEDSSYCERPLIVRFTSSSPESLQLEARPRGADGDFRMTGVAPGAYDGRIWRDLIGDATFDPTSEPGNDRFRIWVPPGRAGRADTLIIGRQRSEAETRP